MFPCCINIRSVFKSRESTSGGKYICSEQKKLFISRPQIYDNFYIYRKMLVSPYGYSEHV